MAQRRARTKSKKDAEPASNQLAGWVQLVLFFMLLGVAGALWAGRDQVSKVFAGFSGAE